MLKKRGDPFKVFVRREAGYGQSVAVRFETFDGRGMLALPGGSRSGDRPVADFEEHEIDAELLRAGRFIHVLPDGSRKSHAMSRVTPERIGQLSSEEWTELTPVTEFGFRYLDVPETALLGSDSAAVVAVRPTAHHAAEVVSASPTPTPTPVRRAVRPAPVATATPVPRGHRVARTLPSPTPVPRRGTPVPSALADAAYDRLDHRAAVEALKQEVAKIEALHQRVAELEQQLEASSAREADLIQLLDRWRKRELGEGF